MSNTRRLHAFRTPISHTIVVCHECMALMLYLVQGASLSDEWTESAQRPCVQIARCHQLLQPAEALEHSAAFLNLFAGL